MRRQFKRLLPIAITLIAMFCAVGFLGDQQIAKDICPQCHSRAHTMKDWVFPHETVEAFYRSHNYDHFFKIPHPEKTPGAFQAWFCLDCSKGWIHPWFTVDVFDQAGPPPNKHDSFLRLFGP